MTEIIIGLVVFVVCLPFAALMAHAIIEHAKEQRAYEEEYRAFLKEQQEFLKERREYLNSNKK